jgi:copper ion binding protein
MTALTLHVPDISCDHCKAAIEQAVGQVPGVRDVSVDVPSKSVHVRYDGLTPAALESAIVDAGYTIATAD